MKQLRILKTPQCRHSERFVTYDATLVLGKFDTTATCSNCTSTGFASARVLATAREEARNALMRVEAPPIVEP